MCYTIRQPETKGQTIPHVNSTETLELFHNLGVCTRGHFLLSSGRHSDEYWEKFRIFEHPNVTERLCGQIAERYRDQAVAVVIGPTTGGALLAQEVARQLGVRCMIAEPAAGGGRELRRGFLLHPGERVLVVDDVLTTGLSVRETLEALRAYGPEILGVELLIDRSNGEASRQFDVPYHALLSVAARSYAPADCPLCRAGQPLVKPGTRKMPDQQ
jgi:orotate phosphoribosyltransferase